MLIVQSDKPRVRRIYAGQLQEEMNTLKDRCKEDQTYCVKPCPRETPHTPLAPVEALLNKVALKAISQNDMNKRLKTFNGMTRTATPQEKSDRS